MSDSPGVDRNVEIKARVSDLERIRQLSGSLADGPPTLLEQEDTYFECPTGRLKLRRFGAGEGELIFYRRADREAPGESRFSRFHTADPAALGAILGRALGVRGVVRKRRWLFLAGQTRIHLDEVEGLGRFVELEVVLAPGQSAEEGVEIAERLQEQLGIAREDLVAVSYIDLSEEAGRATDTE